MATSRLNAVRTPVTDLDLLGVEDLALPALLRVVRL